MRVMPETIRSVGLVVNTQHRPPTEAAGRLVPFLRERGVRPVYTPDVAQAIGDEAGTPLESVLASDIAIVLGGDGTVLHTARRIGALGTPMLTIRFGSFGFLAEAEPEQIESAVTRVLEGDFEIENRPMLRATRTSGGIVTDDTDALNDVALFRGASPRLVKLEAHVNGEPLATYSGDGVVAATATGSTAYSLAAGGPIVHPTIDAFLLTPICPHALHFRPLLLPASAVLTLRVADGAGEAQASVDGQVTFPLLSGDTLSVRRSDSRARFITLPGHATFYGKVRSRLRWGERLL
jgi:NAD+ kinase